jgi:uncharacterized membrane protein
MVQLQMYDPDVLVEYPREGLYSIGLVTGEGREAIDDVAGEQAYFSRNRIPN